MKHRLKNTALLALMAACLFTACKKNRPTDPVSADQFRYVVMTMSESNLTKPGYATVFDKMPTGSVSNINANSLQGSGMGGWRPYQNWIFKMFNTAGNEKGIERITPTTDNKIKSTAFIKTNNTINGSGNFAILNGTKGYYWDADEALKIQIFNPTALSRTGSIDLSVVSKTDPAIRFQAVGQHFLAIKGGKLFADITYGKNTGATSGMFDDYFPDIYVAVIDIATGTYEKTITFPATGSITYINDNQMFNIDEKGDLYVLTQGRTALGGQSKIIRIKSADTDFDKNWEIKMDDIMTGGKFVTVYADKGKIITLIPTERLIGGPTGNINNAEIWQYYSIDIATLTRTKIAGIPKVANPGGAYGIQTLDDKLILRVNAPSAHINGYYELNDSRTIASALFNVTEGGSVSGIYKVKL